MRRGLWAAVVVAVVGVTAASAAPVATWSVASSVDVYDTATGRTLIPVGSKALWTDAEGNVYAGPNTLVRDTGGSGGGNIPDFMWSSNKRRLFTRSLILGELGDAPDLALGRAGPDNQYPDGPPAGTPRGTNLGTVYWRGWCGQAPLATGGGWCDGRSAMIYVRAAEDVYRPAGGPPRNGGSLYLATTQAGQAEASDRLLVTDKGAVVVLGPNLSDQQAAGQAGDLQVAGNIGFRGKTPQPAPVVTGSRGNNKALKSLLAALAAQGLIVDGTS